MTLPARILLLLLLFAALPGRAQIQVRSESNALRLAQQLVGMGVTVQNATYTGGLQSAGYFSSRGANGVGLDSGIVLTNGKVTSLPGPAIGVASDDLGLSGDAFLTALAGRPTSDACILEFDFLPLGDTVRFRYVFSSDEYPDYVCSGFNDAFAFLLSGPGIQNSVNLALVPGTGIPVAINSINSGVPGNTFLLSTCQSMGPGAPFTRLYVDNLQGTELRHNGRTVVLEAMYPVQPCQTYHIRLLIADAGGTASAPDRTFDSGVFLEARSFSAGALSLVSLNPNSAGQAFLAEGCSNGGFEVRSNHPVPLPVTLPIEVRGNATPGVDATPIASSVSIPAGDSVAVFLLSAISDNLVEGIERYQVFLGASCPNSWSDSLLIEIRDYDTVRVSPASPFAFCGEGSAVALHASAGYSNYQWTPAAAFNNPSIADPLVQASDGMLVRVLATEGSCRHADSILLLRKKMRIKGKRDVSCSGRSDGEINIGANALWTAPLLFSIDNRGWSVDSNMYFIPAGTHTVYLRDASGCIDSLTVVIGERPPLQIHASAQDLPCAGVDGQIRLAGLGGSLPYYWSVDGSALSSGNVYDRPAGTYTVLLSDFYQCTVQTTVTIGIMPVPQVQLAITPGTCLLDGRLTVTGPAGMEYSVNSAPYQSFQTTFILPPGPVSLRARHHPGCVQVFQPVIPVQSDLQWTLLHNDTLCAGTAKQLQLQSNALSVQWTGPGLSAATVATPIATPAQTSWYHVSLTRGNCVENDSVQLFVRPAPVASAGADTALCQGDRGWLRGGGGLRYDWKPAAGLANPAAASQQVRPSATTIFSTTVTDGFGCISQERDSVEIRVVPAVRADAGRDTVVALGQPLQLQGRDVANAGVTQYVWTPRLWLSSDTVATPIALPARDITYQLTLRTPEGCSGVAQVRVKVYTNADIYVPDGFTPNADGKNDRLKAFPVGMRAFHYFRVFNRWGALVFETRDAAIGWDGNVRGQQQDTNVYIWVAEGVDYRGNPVLRKGTVVVLR